MEPLCTCDGCICINYQQFTEALQIYLINDIKIHFKYFAL